MRIIDRDGNTIYSKPHKGGFKFFLELASGGYDRTLGTFEDGVVSIVRRPQNGHVLYKADAYGFNYEWLKQIEKKVPDAKVYLYEQKTKKEYKTTIKKILSRGKFLWFNSQGFERQIFLPRNDFDGWQDETSTQSTNTTESTGDNTA